MSDQVTILVVGGNFFVEVLCSNIQFKMIVIGIEIWLQEGFCRAWANMSWIDLALWTEPQKRFKVKIKVPIFNYLLPHNGNQWSDKAEADSVLVSGARVSGL